MKKEQYNKNKHTLYCSFSCVVSFESLAWETISKKLMDKYKQKAKNFWWTKWNKQKDNKRIPTL